MILKFRIGIHLLNNITLCLNCQLSDANKRVTSLIEKVDNNTMSTEKVKPSTDHGIELFCVIFGQVI